MIIVDALMVYQELQELHHPMPEQAAEVVVVAAVEKKIILVVRQVMVVA
jgi:hypothetical protein